ncbi:uncharacterized protein K452DRAFT_294010 [Aplosporella prunicola CBS 121167]|uniref:Meiotically up-regulated protein Msb1/Mug8 domain-containing protein n=1 Tax=Aplosporella prunicola CBS 121167 TaxID=1176127 RepID=A0A6A6BQN4_9PEZI|nr:uncharacterized protein K452DRAFT_294010 [Aplosporella prunicola CBS 121167]KAF2146429.1 hypothetical protein K452DRAFT_294010 [Aplosporella prunicola CBS 121167]
MPFFSKVFKPKDGSKASKKHAQNTNGDAVAPPKPRWEEAWSRTEVAPEEVQELIHICTQELKSRALDTPFLLLPFRPGSDSATARSFIKSFFKDSYEGGTAYRGQRLQSELRLTEPMVLCSIMKWCWSRLPGGVVTWEAYELFRVGEQDSGMAKHAFDTFIPLSVDSESRKQIITDFFDLLAAIAARGKTNGLGGRKLSRMAGWWAFEHTDTGNGFDGGYKSWASAADATSHLFFAYLRCLAPDSKGMVGIDTLPRSLQALVSQTEYPPEPPSLMQTRTTKVVMIVNSVSPTPFALLRRARNFEYREDDEALQRFSTYEDPIQALTDECCRVLNAISSINQSSNADGTTDPSWSRFEDLGFGFLDGLASEPTSPTNLTPTHTREGLKSAPRSRADMGRPTTPSWADFLSTGFVDDGRSAPPPVLLPPDKILPPIGDLTRVHSSQSHLRNTEENGLEPGELASITQFELDETFWWVWMTSLAGEEPNGRKGVFGRCALIETRIAGGKWLVMEEQVKGAGPGPEEGAYIVEKKSKFSFTKRGRMGRKKSENKKLPVPEPYDRTQTDTPMSKASIGPDQHARIHAAATRLAREQKDQAAAEAAQRRGRTEDLSTKTQSVMTLQPMVMNEAGPAMKWAKQFDKEVIRAQYLGDNFAGKGMSKENLSVSSPTAPSAKSNGTMSTHKQDLPPLPKDEPSTPKQVQRKAVGSPVTPQVPVEEAAKVPLPPQTEAEKPHPENDVHPALRKPANDRKVSGPVSERRKMFEQQNAQKSPPSPEAKKEPKKLKKPAASHGGFKKFFGKKKGESSSRSATPEPTEQHAQPEQVSQPEQAHQPAQGGLTVPEQPGLLRRLSNRKKPEVTALAVEAPAPSERQPVPSSINTNEQREADEQFSRFDQGPLDDVPAFVPEDTDDEDDDEFEEAPQAQAPAPPRNFNTRAAAALQPTRSEEVSADVSPDDQSEASIDLAAQQSPTSDRWAQIRQNAAARAARMSDEQQMTRPRRSESQSQRTDDGETSGEETIENRVARIKARVAELTGNMDSSGNIVTKH